MSGSEYRTTYLRALDPECPSPRADELPRVRAALAEVDPGGEEEIPALVAGARAWAEEEGRRFREVLAGPDRGSARDRVLNNCAPLALSAGAWLQWLSGAGNAESELVLRVLSLYAQDIGVGYPHADRGSDYRAVLRAHRLLDEAPGVRLAGSDQVENSAFRFPGLLLAMSRLPEEFRPELLGADLCLRAVGLPPPLAGLDPAVLGVPVDTLDLGAARHGDPRTGLELSRAAAEAVLEVGEGDRLRHGFRWAGHELRLWCDALLRETDLATHPDYDVWRLIWSRARQAAVYHADFPLEGRPLAEWFADVDAGPGAFLGALARSTLVRPGQPDRSPLLRGLIGERGRMFRVFTDDEVAVLRRWIAGLAPDGETPGGAGHERLHRAQRSWYRPDGAPGRSDAGTGAGDGAGAGSATGVAFGAGAGAGSATGVAFGAGAGAGSATGVAFDTGSATGVAFDTGSATGVAFSAGASDDFGRPSAREAYRALLSRAEPPGLRRFAHDYATRWLTRSAYHLDRAPRQLPPRWDPETGLRGWLAAEHDRHAAEHDATEPRLPTREELVESTLQLAPLIMIDGGWLQGFTDHQLGSSAAGHFLFQTYWDELGNGVWELNHPKIYRDLVRQMGVDLPPTDSPAFSAHPGFHDESFELPVYWLCVSRFPRTFAPEILGLNLAMELSGVGGSYRDARLALLHHGFSTQFVDLHNTIDNVSTGHSAWAVDAIDSYLAEQPRADDGVWRRIRVGYRSLNPPEGVAATLYSTLKSRTARYARR
ncbi:iron-containing redox enzyme family protein [Saccharothrix syringae]|uniref:iron-containing redox enzyme family protein n=1 Tax=Saccharothrix syringae TaxID=103733 RepID=UPI000AD4AE73|nr:iron-containing redox enzyme family protein [Saccharothrix syringae]